MKLNEHAKLIPYVHFTIFLLSETAQVIIPRISDGYAFGMREPSKSIHFPIIDIIFMSFLMPAWDQEFQFTQGPDEIDYMDFG